MIGQEVFRCLNELSVSDADGLRKLAGEIAFHCRQPASTVLADWIGGAPTRQTPCAFVCSGLKELAVDEMLGCAESVAPALRVQLMDMVVTQQLAFRELMLTVLEPLLQDTTPVGSAGSIGELRTCDAAYLLVRKVVHLGATNAGQFIDEEQFKALEETYRDREIDEWMLSESWKAIFPDPL